LRFCFPVHERLEFPGSGIRNDWGGGFFGMARISMQGAYVRITAIYNPAPMEFVCTFSTVTA